MKITWKGIVSGHYVLSSGLFAQLELFFVGLQVLFFRIDDDQVDLFVIGLLALEKQEAPSVDVRVNKLTTSEKDKP